MKRGIHYIIVIALGVFCFVSCKKDYHCQCSYQNQIKLVKDLGSQVQSDAQDMCNGYDTTVTGEKWTCVLN